MIDRVVKETELERLLKYSYGGLIFSIVAVLLKPEEVQTIVGILGPILSPLAVIGLGVCIYVLHREVLGELFLYWALSFAHDLWDRIRKRKDDNVTNTLAYLGKLGVELINRRSAYNAIRNSFFEADARTRLDRLHTELHLLWITWDILFAAVVYQLATHGLNVGLLAAFIFLMFAASFADIRLHQVECRLLKKAEKREQQVSNFLRENLFIN